jgi:hypothetical protein
MPLSKSQLDASKPQGGMLLRLAIIITAASKNPRSSTFVPNANVKSDLLSFLSIGCNAQRPREAPGGWLHFL